MAPGSQLWHNGEAGGSHDDRSPSTPISVGGPVVLILFLLEFPAPMRAQSKMIWATSARREHVQAAIDSAKVNDTVMIPPGVAVWSDSVYISRGICVVGAGVGRTIITHAKVGFRVSVPAPPEIHHRRVRNEHERGRRIQFRGYPLCIQTEGDCQQLRITPANFIIPERREAI